MLSNVCIDVSAATLYVDWNNLNGKVSTPYYAATGNGDGLYTSSQEFEHRGWIYWTYPDGLLFKSACTYRVAFYFDPTITYNATKVIDGACRNTYYLEVGGELHMVTPGWNYFLIDNVESYKFSLVIDSTVTFREYTGSQANTPYFGYIQYTTSVSARIMVYDVTSDNLTSDDKVNSSVQQGNQLQQQGNELQEKQNQLQEEQNQLQEEANETSKNIFDKISDFFGSFFDNIINAFKSLFIPEDDYFSEFFNRLNDFFAEKLGMLYAPIDLFIQFLTVIQNAGGADAGIPFPGVEWDGVYIIEPQTISLKTYTDEFPELQEKIYFVTDIMMVGAVLWLLQVKLKEVLQN